MCTETITPQIYMPIRRLNSIKDNLTQPNRYRTQYYQRSCGKLIVLALCPMLLKEKLIIMIRLMILSLEFMCNLQNVHQYKHAHDFKGIAVVKLHSSKSKISKRFTLSSEIRRAIILSRSNVF